MDPVSEMLCSLDYLQSKHLVIHSVIHHNQNAMELVCLDTTTTILGLPSQYIGNCTGLVYEYVHETIILRIRHLENKIYF